MEDLSSNLNDLPLEIIFEIFKCLEFPKFFNIFLVSKQFESITRQPFFWRYFFLREKEMKKMKKIKKLQIPKSYIPKCMNEKFSFSKSEIFHKVNWRKNAQNSYEKNIIRKYRKYLKQKRLPPKYGVTHFVGYPEKVKGFCKYIDAVLNFFEKNIKGIRKMKKKVQLKETELLKTITSVYICLYVPSDFDYIFVEKFERAIKILGIEKIEYEIGMTVLIRLYRNCHFNEIIKNVNQYFSFKNLFDFSVNLEKKYFLDYSVFGFDYKEVFDYSLSMNNNGKFMNETLFRYLCKKKDLEIDKLFLKIINDNHDNSINDWIGECIQIYVDNGYKLTKEMFFAFSSYRRAFCFDSSEKTNFSLHGIDINCTDNDGNTLFHKILQNYFKKKEIKNELETLIEKFLKLGTNFLKKNKEGFSSFDYFILGKIDLTGLDFKYFIDFIMNQEKTIQSGKYLCKGTPIFKLMEDKLEEQNQSYIDLYNYIKSNNK